MPKIQTKQYVEFRDQGYWIAGTRIALDSVVYAFWDKLFPENIVQAFPLLSLEQVYGAIAFYLANLEEIDAYLATEAAEFAAMPQPLQTDAPELHQKLKAAKAKR
ncbi:MAG: DUF433 domain-containing protein [Spirulinaceae cyanobacterium]